MLGRHNKVFVSQEVSISTTNQKFVRVTKLLRSLRSPEDLQKQSGVA